MTFVLVEAEAYGKYVAIPLHVVVEKADNMIQLALGAHITQGNLSAPSISYLTCTDYRVPAPHSPIATRLQELTDIFDSWRILGTTPETYTWG